MAKKAAKAPQKKTDIIAVSASEFSSEQAREISDATGDMVVMVKDINSIKKVTHELPTGFELFTLLKKAGFHQGGQGRFLQDPNSDEKVYMPTPDELYNQFAIDPKEWEKVTEALARVFIDLKTPRKA